MGLVNQPNPYEWSKVNGVETADWDIEGYYEDHPEARPGYVPTMDPVEQAWAEYFATRGNEADELADVDEDGM